MARREAGQTSGGAAIKAVKGPAQKGSKPNLDYYREVLRRAGLDAESCLMVGNDVGEDMIAAELGMKVFLLTDCMINKNGEDISRYPNGGFDELREYIADLQGQD